jgi:hypothetical protein
MHRTLFFLLHTPTRVFWLSRSSKLKKLIKDDCLNLALYRFLADKPVTAQLQCDGTNRNGK